MIMENTLSIGMKDEILLIEATGQMRAGECMALNDFLGPYLEKVRKPVKIMIDLHDCTYMDSTAIGFILSLQSKCLKYMPESVTVLNPSEKCKEHLKKLHSLNKLTISENATVPDIPLFAITTDTPDTGSRKNIELVFQAHRILSDINEKNRREFQDLMDELTRVLGK